MCFRLDIVQNKRFDPPPKKKNLTELFFRAIVLFREVAGYQSLGFYFCRLVIRMHYRFYTFCKNIFISKYNNIIWI